MTRIFLLFFIAATATATANTKIPTQSTANCDLQGTGSFDLACENKEHRLSISGMDEDTLFAFDFTSKKKKTKAMSPQNNNSKWSIKDSDFDNIKFVLFEELKNNVLTAHAEEDLKFVRLFALPSSVIKTSYPAGPPTNGVNIEFKFSAMISAQVGTTELYDDKFNCKVEKFTCAE